MARSLRLKRLWSRASFGARPEEWSKTSDPDAAAWLAAQLDPDRDTGLGDRLDRFEQLGLPPEAVLGAAGLPEREQADRSDAAKRELKSRARSATLAVVGARVVRAVHSERQLQEVMVDFWSNHFSVFSRKGPIGVTLPDYERNVIERHALGRFGDLLSASARSPAMLLYLDNWISTAPQGFARRRGGRRSSGLNENYARELLELHTLGVDGGYTEGDVREVARAFTGWTLESRRRPSFRFRERLHDPAPKVVLGEKLRGHGLEEGEGLLERLARHPETARFISRKLVSRFVADLPPPVLVERTARRFLETEGDIAKVLISILLSPEFATAENRKLKTPFRFAVSALRTTGGESDGGRAILGLLARLGELPYAARTPAGFPEAAPHWLDPAAMLERMNGAFAVASGRLPGTRLGEVVQDASLRDMALPPRDAVAVSIAAPEFQWA